jgi:hypothetical protein
MAHRLVTLFRKAKAHRGQDFATRVVQAFYRNRYATKSPTVDKYVFDESKHPRGQPENAGEFAEVHATIGDKPGEGVHMTLQHGSQIVAPEQHQGTQTLDSPIEPLESDVKLMDGEPPRDPNVETPPDPETVARTPEELGSIESALSNEKIVDGDICPDKHNSNEVWFVKLENGQQGVFKPGDKEFQNGRKDIPNNTLGIREVAAYEVAKVIGLDDLVPVTVMHTAHNSGQIGSMQEFCPDAEVARKLEGEAPYDGKRDGARAVVFDFIMGNTDRHSKNWMIDKTGKIRLIDNGYCLPERHGLQTVSFMSQRQNQLAAHYSRLSLDEAKAEWKDKLPEVESVLKKAGISDAAIAKMKERYDIIMGYKDWGDAIDALFGRVET